MNESLRNSAEKAIMECGFEFPYSADEWINAGLPVENYHKHTTWSNFFQIDSTTSLEAFAEFGDSRGAHLLFSGEHGYQGEWIAVYDYCAKTGRKFRYSVEAYWVKDRAEKDNTNCHIVLVARNYNAVRKLNYILSEANENGFYYRPRIDLDLLFTLTPDDVYVTSACVAGWKYDDADTIWLRVAKHFGESFFFEYQAHNTDRQKGLNAHIRQLAQDHNIQTIIGLDTHYITHEDRIKRDNLFLRKGIRYDDEDGWYMDWPSGSEILDRFVEQGVLSQDEIIRSMVNTHVFVSGCEDFSLNTDFKIPVLPQYQGMTYEQRSDALKALLNEQYKKEDEAHRDQEHIAGLRYEADQIIGSGIVDYFLDDYHIIKLATSPEYGGHLTTTSRGSAGSYYTSKLLGFTTLDRFEAEVPIYPERFMTKERILSSHQCADVDLNCSEQEPFVKASKDLLGEHSCYPLLAVGKLKEKSAFKLYAGVNHIDPQIANEVTTMIDQYNEALKNADEECRDDIQIEDYIRDPELLRLYDESISYQNIIEQSKVHACGHFLFNGDQNQPDVIGYGDIRYEVGLIRCTSESTGNSVLVACVEGQYLDPYGYVKNDYLIVDVVSIINKLYASIGMEVPTVAELRKMVDGDEATWKMYEDGATCCLNQCEKSKTTQRVMQYKPKNPKELAAFIAAIRPGFKSHLDGFLARVPYTNGEPAIDKLLSGCFNYMLYQEAIMGIFSYLGIPMKDAYDTIKKISKKKLKGEQLKKVENTLKAHWLDKIGNMDNFDAVYQVIKDSARYGFNAPHALSMAFDSLYAAWFKAHHTSKFYEVVLNHYQGKGDKDKIASILKEAKAYFGYTVGSYAYGNDHSAFTINDETKTIYPSLASIKGIGEQAAKDLSTLSGRKLSTMLDFLKATSGTSINKTVVANLAKIGYFSPFCKSEKALACLEAYNYWFSNPDGRKKIPKAELSALGLSESELVGFATDVLASGKVSQSQYTILDINGLVEHVMAKIPDTELPAPVRARNEYEVIGSVSVMDDSIDRRICVVTNFDDKYSPRFDGYCVNNGKVRGLKVRKADYKKAPFEDGAVLYLKSCKAYPKKRKVNGEWKPVDGEVEWWVNDYFIIR